MTSIAKTTTKEEVATDPHFQQQLLQMQEDYAITKLNLILDLEYNIPPLAHTATSTTEKPKTSGGLSRALTRVGRKPSGHSNLGASFGVPLAQVPMNAFGVPVAVETLVEYVCTGLKTEGVVRRVGNLSRSKELRELLNKTCHTHTPITGGQLSDPFWRQSNNMEALTVHDAMTTLKQFLRALPEPLLTFRLHHALQRAAEQRKDLRECGTLTRSLQFIVFLLPTTHKRLLRYLVRFLSTVTANHESNKMDAVNVAACIAPTVMSDEEQWQGDAAKHDGPSSSLFSSCGLLSAKQPFWSQEELNGVFLEMLLAADRIFYLPESARADFEEMRTIKMGEAHKVEQSDAFCHKLSSTEAQGQSQTALAQGRTQMLEQFLKEPALLKKLSKKAQKEVKSALKEYVAQKENV